MLDAWAQKSRHYSISTGCNGNVWINFGHEFRIPEQVKMSVTPCVRKHSVYESELKEYIAVSAQNVLHESQGTPRNVSSWTAASVQRSRGSCRWSERHPQCDGEVSLRREQQLHTHGCLGVHRGFKCGMERGACRPCSGSSCTAVRR
jgi:hypothetical protein